MRFDIDFLNDASPDSALSGAYIGFFTCFLGLVFGLAALSSDDPFGGLIGGALIVWIGTRLIIRARKSNVGSFTEASIDGIIDISKRQSTTFIVLGFIVMFVFGLAPILIEFNVRTDDNFHYFFWLFSVIGFFFFNYGRGKIRDYNEFGPLLLLLDEGRGVIGGDIAGRFNIKGIPTAKKVDLHLICKELYKTRVNDEIKLREIIRLKQEIEPLIDSNLSGQSDIEFETIIPENYLPSFANGSSGKIHWYIELAGEFTALSGRTVVVDRRWRVPISASE
ncbi:MULTISPECIES: hypothetical protein [unclassified Neptuniibacter]|uniref:hypothetical protein n=1 Tax=unclassified Neptuniibacter TaxID=2630693 RepID=UPI0025D9AD05|nr:MULTISPECIES: hypothetical protein [unclassified Neptuniibacter]|tara:strand:- start:34604 stop:35440 length:837 start_codon:yes stop_codon:yes gene_type:complete